MLGWLLLFAVLGPLLAGLGAVGCWTEFGGRGFRVQAFRGLGLRVRGLGLSFMVGGLGFRAEIGGVGCRV